MMIYPISPYFFLSTTHSNHIQYNVVLLSTIHIHLLIIHAVVVDVELVLIQSSIVFNAFSARITCVCASFRYFNTSSFPPPGLYSANCDMNDILFVIFIAVFLHGLSTRMKEYIIMRWHICINSRTGKKNES